MFRRILTLYGIDEEKSLERSSEIIKDQPFKFFSLSLSLPLKKNKIWNILYSILNKTYSL